MQKSVDFLQTALRGSWQRNSAIASNIANYNTPGYKRVDYNFEEALREKLGAATMVTTHSKHYKRTLTSPMGESLEFGTKYRIDGNNVDINVENAELAKNSIYFQVVSDELNSQFQRMKAAMKIGK